MTNNIIEVENHAVDVRSGDISVMLAESKKVSIEASPEEFMAIVSQSNDEEAVKAAVAEVINKRTPLTVWEWCVSVLPFASVIALVVWFWPSRTKPVDMHESLDSILTVESEAYETEEYLINKLK